MTTTKTKQRRKTIKFINITSRKPVEYAVLKSQKIQYFNKGIANNIIKAFRTSRMNVKIHLFGSRVIGLAHKKSDLDIYVEYDDNFYSDKDVERDREVLKKIANIIDNKKGWYLTAKILDASVPILQFLFKPANLKCDISVSNGLGVANSLMLTYLFDLQPESKKFYHFMRLFLQRYKECIEGYLLKLLVIFFLQNEKLLPPVKMIQQNMDVEHINGWPTTEINTARSISYYELILANNYRNYIPKFFEFYSKFEYSKYVMSIYDGIQLERDSYKYPEELENHVLCIFGPLNRKNNIGKYLSDSQVEFFIFKCCKNVNKEISDNLENYNFKD